MGRARGYGASRAATGGVISRFDAVLGARRGSASAQATRDTQENQTRDHAITEMISELNLPSGTSMPIDRLAKAYRSGGAVAGTPEYEQLCRDLIPTTAVKFFDLANMSVYGDPECCPGLTAPAVDTLGSCLRPAVKNFLPNLHDGPLPLRARLVANSILEYGIERGKEPYERLAPVLEGMATILQHLPLREHGVRAAALSMAEMLCSAPTSALDGPLRPLVQAFRQRILDGKLTSAERKLLERHITDQVPTSQPAKALRPIADAL